MVRRLLCLYFPGLAIDRLQREDPSRRLRPVAVTREENGHFRITAINAPASRGGILPGARLNDARTLLPNLEVVPDDAEADGRVKQRLIEWCDRYSPLVADDGFDGIVLDITGCANLFGGETALLVDLQSRIRRTGYRVRGAIAETLGAAWALARYGEETSGALGPLPVEALRLPEEVTRELRRVGLATIAAVRKIPRQSLATRYGPGVLLRLDQAFGDAEEPITPFRPPAPHRAGRTLAEPIGTIAAVQYVLLDLLMEICSRLEKEQLGARRLNLDCYRVDGTVASCHINTSKPVRSVTHLMRLFTEKLETLDAGFGIETLVLTIPDIETADPVQLTLPQFDGGVEEDAPLDGLIDRLGARLGFQQVCRFRICESLLPEYAIEFCPVTAPVIPNAEWPENRVRPVRLIDPPIRIEVSAMLQLRIGRRMHRIVRAEGPERLTPEWWRDESLPWKTRDYYRIEDDKGARFWIFQASGWFLHGHLP